MGLAAPFLITAAKAATAPILLELFTSQGCSSCPPADAFAAQLVNNPNLKVISLNVDYWDYLGWKDTLAMPEFTRRQMDYAHARGDMDVYTPQMVINGKAHAVGSNHSEVEAAIAAAQPATELQVAVSDREFKITLPNPTSIEATLWMMKIAPQVDVNIERGENAGKLMTYHNVVRKMTKLATWNGTDKILNVPHSGIANADLANTTIIVQNGLVGPVIALGRLA